MKEFCQLHGITKDAYFYWLKKVREAAIESSGIELVELKEPASLPPSVISGADTVFKTEATISSGNFTISVNSNTPKELLISLMEAAANVK